MGWKITSAIAGVAAGFVARKVVKRTWEMATGEDAPDSPEDPRLTWGQAIAFAAVSGVVMEVVRTVAARGAGQYYANKTGLGPFGADLAELTTGDED